MQHAHLNHLLFLVDRLAYLSLGFTAKGSGVCGLRLGLGLSVQLARLYHLLGGLEFRILGFWFRVSVFGFRVSVFWFRVSGFGFRFSDFGFRCSVFEFRF